MTALAGTMEAQSPVRRVIEPFVYFRDHASAIAGLGGKYRSPNPNYCFHSHYFEYRPGVVLFHVRIRDARASQGELEIRVHGYRPDNPDLGIKLVTAMRVSLVDLSEDAMEVSLRIAAIPGVHYAVFGQYIDSGDLRAASVEIEAEEHGGETAEDYGDGPAPELTVKLERPEIVSALVADRPALLAMPGSQACTVGQLGSDEFRMAFPRIGHATGADTDNLARWRQVYMLRLLERFGFLKAGACGIALGAMPQAMETALHDRDCLMAACSDAEKADPALTLAGRGYVDFLICLDASAHCEDPERLSWLVTAALRRLVRGGIAVILIDYDAEPAGTLAGEAASAPRGVFTRGDIERLALHLIGHGSNVAQLSFPSGRGEDAAPARVVPFGLAVRR